ncbi:MAG TPA: tetratricopeptide repeat-containing glycosyltransferase family protein [Bradyrhizobium sp.]|nr:tetratricopeptide repeat-containing glycosyltransferase family protein [Bradyrhizobium sp.]
MAALDLTELAPDDIAELRRFALALHQAGRRAEAVKIYRQAIAIDPADVAILNNLAACLCDLDRLDEAAAASARAVALAPQDALLWSNHAAILLHAGEIDAALAVSHRAVALAPQHPTVRFNHSHLLLLCGDLQNGFSGYRFRRQCAGLFSSRMNFSAPEWQGEPFVGRRLLLFAEQGIGDALQFIRYLPMVAARGGDIMLSVQDALAPLLAQLDGVTVIPRSAPLPPFDLQLALMDLPHLFGTTLDSIPAEIPYLHADPDRVEVWRRSFGDVAVLKVGLVWAGSAIHKGDRYRSLPAEAVLPRLRMPGVQLYSLQKEPRAADLAVLAALGGDVIDLAPALGDFADTAAAVTALDLVISVDTSVVHLAGAMGRPAWVLLPYAQDWRWLRERDDSPWYPSLRLFRQETPQAWDVVLTRVTAALGELARTR